MDSSPLPERLRTVDPLVMELSAAADGKITVSSPRLRTRLRVAPLTAELLMAAQSGIKSADHPHSVLARLVRNGFLVDADVEPEPAAPPWDDWGTTAWSFHARIKDTPYISFDQGQLEEYRTTFTRRPRPAGTRPSGDRILLLPRVRTRLAVSYTEVLENRRTCRHFADHAMSLDAFSDLLHYTFAPLRFADSGEVGVQQLRACAASGARHETEAFVFVFDVDAVRPGLYHYDGIRHGLEPLPGPAGRADLEDLTFGQGFFTHASFGVLTAAAADRMAWKYTQPAAYRMLIQNVGHMAQVFSMTATALGFGAALTGAIKGTQADALLGLHEPEEFTTFAMACGLPLREPNGLPKLVRPPGEPPDYY